MNDRQRGTVWEVSDRVLFRGSSAGVLAIVANTIIID
jgi:hypothetical protein